MSQIHKHDIPANIADRCLINPSSTTISISNLSLILTLSGASRAIFLTGSNLTRR